MLFKGTNGIVNGPKSIVDDWPSLKKAGFKTVDNALPNPNDKEEAYFFGDSYIRIKVRPGEPLS